MPRQKQEDSRHRPKMKSQEARSDGHCIHSQTAQLDRNGSQVRKSHLQTKILMQLPYKT